MRPKDNRDAVSEFQSLDTIRVVIASSFVRGAIGITVDVAYTSNFSHLNAAIIVRESDREAFAMGKVSPVQRGAEIESQADRGGD